MTPEQLQPLYEIITRGVVALERIAYSQEKLMVQNSESIELHKEAVARSLKDLSLMGSNTDDLTSMVTGVLSGLMRELKIGESEDE